MAVIKQALISVSDKTGLLEFARGLADLGVALLSTGGTAQQLRDAGITVTEVADHTGFPEMLDGRVKTLHPKVHGGILARRDVPGHLSALARAGIPTIDLVVVNLYPFGATVARPGCTLAEAIENIDIGGPAMVRSAAKNYVHVAVVTDPADYASVLKEMAPGGALSADTRFRLAQKAFSHTAQYDGAISNYLTSLDAAGERARFPQRLNLQFERVQAMRYGENPHQEAAFYRDLQPVPGSLGGYRQLQGKALSYNNIADADAAWECVKSFARAGVRHRQARQSLRRGGRGEPAAEAYRKAVATDPTSAFGGIIAFNRELDGATAQAVMQQFVEVVIAPGIAPEATRVLAGKSNVRVLEVPLAAGANDYDFKRVGGGLLVQTPDSAERRGRRTQDRYAQKAERGADRRPAVCLARGQVRQIQRHCVLRQRADAGRRSRPDEPRRRGAHRRHQGRERRPDADGLGGGLRRLLPVPRRGGRGRRAGAAAIIQPGGSVRDEEVIAAADEHGIAMVFTGVRHFRH